MRPSQKVSADPFEPGDPRSPLFHSFVASCTGQRARVASRSGALVVAQIMNEEVLPDEFMPPESGWGCLVVGPDDDGVKRRMADTVGAIIKAVLNNGYDLSRLEGTTISACYAQSLAELDRGFEASAPSVPSQEHVTGKAMAAPVMRSWQG